MEYKTCMLVVMVTLALCQVSVYGIVCPPNYCDTVDCAQTSRACAENEMLVQGGSFCGCCSVCRVQLDLTSTNVKSYRTINSNLEDQTSLFVSPGDRVVRLYPRTLGVPGESEPCSLAVGTPPISECRAPLRCIDGVCVQ